MTLTYSVLPGLKVYKQPTRELENIALKDSPSELFP